jgi:fumarate hydratase class II
MAEIRGEYNGLGKVEFSAELLRDAETQYSPERFSIGRKLTPREIIATYQIVKAIPGKAKMRDGRLAHA